MGSHSVKDVWNSLEYQKIRQQMLNGEWPSECDTCEYREKNNLVSPRQNYVKKWNLTQSVCSVEIDNNQIRSADMRFGNICNLKCRMCTPAFSSQIAEEWAKNGWISDSEKYNSKINHWLDSPKTFENLEKIIENLEELKIEGSEPTITPAVFRLLNMIIDSGKSRQITLNITTNLTNINQEFKDKLKHFSKIEMQVSIDGLEEVNNYIRFPSKWNTIVKNMNTYLKMPNVNVLINHTVQLYNIMSIDKFINWYCDNYKSTKNIRLNIAPIHSPNYHSCSFLPKELKLQILEKIKNIDSIILRRLNVGQQLSLLKITESPKIQNEKWNQFVTYTKNLDKIRNQDILKIVPEYEKFFVEKQQ